MEHNREKRFVGFLGGLLLGGIGCAIWSAVNGASIDHIQGKQRELIRHINHQRLHLELLEKGFTKMVKEQGIFMDYVHEEVDRIYDVIERMKCPAEQTHAQLAFYIAFNEYRTYLNTHTQAALETLLTGRLLPRVLPPNRLRAMLDALPQLRAPYSKWNRYWRTATRAFIRQPWTLRG